MEAKGLPEGHPGLARRDSKQAADLVSRTTEKERKRERERKHECVCERNNERRASFESSLIRSVVRSINDGRDTSRELSRVVERDEKEWSNLELRDEQRIEVDDGRFVSSSSPPVVYIRTCGCPSFDLFVGWLVGWLVDWLIG